MLDLSQKITHIFPKNIPSRQKWGRYIYQIQQNQHYFWLKYQLPIDEPKNISFQQELDYYQLLSKIDARLIIPYQIAHLAELSNQNEIIQQHLQQYPNINALILADTSPFLTQPSKHIDKVQQQLLEIVEYLYNFHQHGLIHGDIKMEHIVQYQQQIYMIDFEQTQSIWLPYQTTTLTATPRYLAPELFTGKTKTKQSDIYALGVVLYEWLMQSKLSTPNHQTSYQAWQNLHQQGITVHLPKNYQIFQYVIQTMLMPNPQRFEDCSEIMDILENI